MRSDTTGVSVRRIKRPNRIILYQKLTPGGPGGRVELGAHQLERLCKSARILISSNMATFGGPLSLLQSVRVYLLIPLHVGVVCKA